MPGQDEKDPQLNHDLPWNRHKRRRLLTSRGVIKGSLGGETSVLRTFRMSGKELVKETVSQRNS